MKNYSLAVIFWLGFVLDDERLKTPDLPFDYFEELLRCEHSAKIDSIEQPVNNL